MIFVCAVREIEAGYVHATAEQIAHLGFSAAGRSDSADDFGATRARVLLGRVLLGIIQACFQTVPR
jgi:hypothetical protein